MRSMIRLLVLGVVLQAGVAMAATITVNQVGFAFDPADITAAPGDTIEWNWASGTHTVTSGAPCVADGRFDSPLTSGNPTVSYVIPMDEPDGVIDYFCSPHCGPFNMVGTITVEGAAVPSTSQWGMLIMALMMVSAGTLVFVLRRRNVLAG